MSDNFKTAFWPGWETVELIGRGSFGAVYKIERKVFNDTESAALKVISIPQNDGDIEELYSDGYDSESITNTFQSHLESIVAEYSLMRKMNGCANIVNCDDVRYVQHDDGIGWDIYIKMELLTPLTKALPTDVSEETVIKIAKDMCHALMLCKKQGIVHRDIKPQNIFVSPYGDYKLGDFGIAKTVEKTTGGTKIGTYKYMAPEVYNNRPYNAQADIYSLGLVLYWLLNKRRMPFLPLPPAKPGVGQDEEARNRRLSGEKLPEPACGSKELKRIVLKACAYAPDDRYASAEQLLDDLNHLTGEATAIYEVASGTAEDVKLQVEDMTVGPAWMGEVPQNDKPSNETLEALDEDATMGPVFTINEEKIKAPKTEKKRGTVIAVIVAAVAAIVLILLLLKSCDGGAPEEQPTQAATQPTQATTQPTQATEPMQTTPPTEAQYKISWKTDKGYDIAVTRISSSNADAANGALENGATIYEGDMLTVAYSAKPGYAISGTGSTNITVSKDITEAEIYATATLEKYTVSWKTESTYEVSIKRTASPNGGAAAGKIVSGETVYYGDVLEVTYTAKPGFSLDGAGSAKVTVTGNITDADIHAAAKAKAYTASWKTDSTYDVTVERTASPNAGAASGKIKNGGAVYHGDVLKVTYAAKTGYTLKKTGSAKITVNGNVTATDIYASTAVNSYTASWNTGSGYSITVNRTSSPLQGASTGTLSNGATIYYGDVLSVAYVAKTGYTLNKTGSVSITVKGNVAASDIYASATVNSYSVKWYTGTGYSITVKRASSPLQGAATGTLGNGSTVYYGDVLSVSYAANTGYSLDSKGSTSITVTGNVTSSNIYATASAKSYTYNVVYKSSNGTSLGTATATYKYGTTNTITPPSIGGYDAPGKQVIVWDSTSAKTITFVYTPKPVTNTAKTGTAYYNPTVTYSATVEYRNRTATSVQIRISVTATIQNTGYTVYGQRFSATANNVGTGAVEICAAGSWNSTSSARSKTGTSGWITVSLSTTNATTVSMKMYYYQVNYNGTDMTANYGEGGTNVSWTVNVPAY